MIKKFNDFIKENQFGVYGGDQTEVQNTEREESFPREKTFGKGTKSGKFEFKSEEKAGTFIDEEGHEEITKVPGSTKFPKGTGSWKEEGGKLYKKFKFPDFKQAFGFMEKVAKIAEEMNHHPEWKNLYNTIEIWLSTHEGDCNNKDGITEEDYDLASKIDSIFK